MSLTKVSYSMINGAKLNALDFGATGDGVTNDYDSLNAAIVAAADAGGGVIYLPTGTYYIGNNTLQMREAVSFEGVGQLASVVKGDNHVFDIGGLGPMFRIRFENMGIEATDNTKSCIKLSNAGALQVTGQFMARNVLFDGDQSIFPDSANFFYAGNILLDYCIFKKFLHLNHTAGLINTIRITNCLFNTTGSAAGDYLCILGNVGTTGFNQAYMSGTYFEVPEDGGILVNAGNTIQFDSIWFYDSPGPDTAISVESGAFYVSMKNIFARPASGSRIRVRGQGPVIVENTNLILDDTSLSTTTTLLPRFSSTFGSENDPVLFGYNHNGNPGDIYISTRKPTGVQIINIPLDATSGTGVTSRPVGSQYLDSLFKRIIAAKLTNGSAGIADPGASYTFGVRARYGAVPTTLFSWTNANVALGAFETVTVADCGVFDGSDFTDWVDVTQRDQLYIDIIKGGAGETTGPMTLTLYVM